MFLRLKWTKNLNVLGSLIRKRLSRWLGMPVCVGIAPTKTLAKFANHCAKTQDSWQGVCDFSKMKENEINQIMANVDVSKVWGVGAKTSAKLKKNGYQFCTRFKIDQPSQD